MASHRMEISSSLLFLSHLIVLTYGHPVLKTPERVTGTWKGDVKIQCIYDPLTGYREVLVKWLVQRGSDHVTIFLRDYSGDHVQQAKYRGRLKVSHKVPGDVSLQLNNLQMDDRNHYTCEVTWQTPDGDQVRRDKITELRVQKYPYKPPTITTEALTTMQSSLEATTITSSTSNLTTCVTQTPQRTTTVPEYVYEVSRMYARETSNSEETTRVTTIANAYFNNEPDSQALINDYSDDPCLSQEYQITTRSTMTIPAC